MFVSQGSQVLDKYMNVVCSNENSSSDAFYTRGVHFQAFTM